MRKIVRKSETLQARADPLCAYLHPGFSQVDLECQLLPGVDIRVVGLGKDPLQLLQLGAGERGPDAPLLPLLVQSSVVREELVGNCGAKIGDVTSALGPSRVSLKCGCCVVGWKQKVKLDILSKIRLRLASRGFAIVLRL